jgi:phosphoribosylformylglycinamidine (FGAM) synthase-like enzyme
MTTTMTSAFSLDILRQHGLTPDEYDKLKQLLGQREPTLTELGIFSVMWSEHCSYKSSRVHLKRLRHIHHGRTTGCADGFAAVWTDHRRTAQGGGWAHSS